MSIRFPKWRLRLVSVFAAVIVCVLFYRIIQVQVFRHRLYNELAENQWHFETKWPARRGRIFDRNGYPVAVSHKTYTIGITQIDFPVNDDAAEYLASVLGKTRSSIKRILKRKDSYFLLGKDLCLTGEQEARLSSLSGIKIDLKPERLNPLSSIAPGFIGSIDDKGIGTGGIEVAFQEYLCGIDGWLLKNRDAMDQLFIPVNAPGKKPVDGNDLYLTIDSRIQSIVDFELEQAVGRYGAVGGVAIVADPQNGNIIAISEKQGTSGKKGTEPYHDAHLYSASCMYEPGSTFKLITDAFLLESGMVEPYDVFYGEQGTARFDFGKFSDDHPFGWMTFKESFVHSSNICTIKAVKDVEKRDFYSFLLRMGFGSRTGIDLPAESKGHLRKLSLWSSRSLPSIAIGQEIGVTPLQMVMAYCAVANGGRLLVPRVVTHVMDPLNREVRDYPVVEVRRVFSPRTVETLVDFCKDAVEEGTGGEAAVDGVEVAGKTGTAQKSDGRRYIEDKYIASFIGFAPADDPRLVCFVMLDEPDAEYHYGGISSAVVFRKIMEGINLSTDIFAYGNGNDIAIGYEEKKDIRAPNFLRLAVSEAERLSSDRKIQICYSRTDGEVYSQVPGPGTLISSGDSVYLSFRCDDTGRMSDVSVPDLRGLSIRKARRMLLECGLKSRIEGYGIVRKQSPAPGCAAKQGSLVKLYCKLLKTGSGGLAAGATRKATLELSFGKGRS